MRAWRTILAIVGAFAILLSVWEIRRTAVPHRTLLVNANGCHIPLTIAEPPEGRPLGNLILFHGLSANRRLMQYLGDDLAADGSLRAYMVDLPGHGDNIDRFSFARAQQCAADLVESLIRNRVIAPANTVVLGHSMGGAIAIQLADVEPVAATVAISPAPMILPQRMPANLLIFSGQFDLWPLKRAARELEQAAGGDRTSAEDFLQQRAFSLENVSRATHTSLLFNSQVERDSLDWIENSLEAAAHNSGGVFDWNNREQWQDASEENGGLRSKASVILDWLADFAPFLGLAGVVLLFPFAIAVVTALTVSPGHEAPAGRPTRGLALLEGAICAMAGVLFLTLGTPMKFLHLYTGAYLASLLAIVGILFLALNHHDARVTISRSAVSAWIVAVALGFAAVFSVGAWLNWQISDAWLNAPRWMRFAALLPVLWIFSISEEVVLGPAQKGRHRAIRYLVFLLLRLELWLACVFAVYRLASGQVLIPLLLLPMAGFSVLQRLGADSLRHRTGSATAAAIFSAILGTWFIAAVFPLS